jgi:SIT family siderophore-iron:H+ symporter-like MFS transporter
MFGERRARRMGVLDGVPTTWQLAKSGRGWAEFFWTGDVIGLILLTGTLALILIPISLGGSVASKWQTAKVITPLVIGVVIFLPAFIVWEAKLAKHPMVPARILRNRHVLCSMLISMLGCVSLMTQGSYLLYMLLVSFGKSVEAATRVANLSSFVQTVVGIILGFAVRKIRRVKWFIVAGCCALIIAYGLLIRYRGGHSQSDFAGIVGGEVMMGIAGGLTTFPAQVGLQAVVKHEHLAIVTALFLTFYQVGAAIGGACAGGIWVNTLPPRLLKGLLGTGMDPAEAAKLAASVFGNPIAFIAQHPVGTPTREAVEFAYRDVQRFLCILGICLGSVMLLVSLGLDNVYLPDTQEAKDVIATSSDEDVPRLAPTEQKRAPAPVVA